MYGLSSALLVVVVFTSRYKRPEEPPLFHILQYSRAAAGNAKGTRVQTTPGRKQTVDLYGMVAFLKC